MVLSSVDDDGDDSQYYTHDPFEGIDLDAIPELTQAENEPEKQGKNDEPVPQASVSDDRQDDQPLNKLGSVANGPSRETPTGPLCRPTGDQPTTKPCEKTSGANSPSTTYSDDEYNAEFLAQLDSLESNILHEQCEPARCPSSTKTAVLDLAVASTSYVSSDSREQTNHEGEPHEAASAGPTRSPRKRSRSLTVDSNQSPAASQQGPRSEKKLRKLMEGFEDEMTCPICCDIFACAYLFNPCGHSYCGECGLSWIAKNGNHPICAVCRTNVSKRNSMVPNIAMDNTVQRHVDALGENGVDGWQEGGEKWLEWNHRKEQWKVDGVSRLSETKKKRKKKG